jgi:uncharacterized protein YukE
VGLVLPAELQWLEWIVGSDWPEGDETAMRRGAQAWVDVATDINELIGDLQATAAKVLGTVDGEGAEAFRKYFETYVSTDPQYLRKLSKACEALGQALNSGANEIEYAKYMFIALLIITAIEITMLIASAVATFGASNPGSSSGAGSGMRVGDRSLNARDVADLIRSDPNWNGREVMLISCETGQGADSFASRLSGELGVPVIAPDGLAWTDNQGRVFSSSGSFDTDGTHSPTWPPDGGWNAHNPDGTVRVTRRAGPGPFARRGSRRRPAATAGIRRGSLRRR